jgi:hypothetical protein
MTYMHGGGTFGITLAGSSAECADVFRAVNAAALSVYRHRAGNSNVTFTMNVGGTCSNSTSGTTPCMSNPGANRKFTISHEMGHAITYARDPEIVSGDCSVADSQCPDGLNDHSMASLETSKCAFREAAAHFYAADTYNNHYQDECAFNYYKNYSPADPDLGQPVVDCEGWLTDQSSIEGGGTPSYSLFPIKTMETLRPPNFTSSGCTKPWANRAVEVDYLRVLWSMHTSANSTDFTPMIDWMAAAFNGGPSNAYNELGGAANEIGGNIDSEWDTYKFAHGVDHP